MPYPYNSTLSNADTGPAPSKSGIGQGALAGAASGAAAGTSVNAGWGTLIGALVGAAAGTAGGVMQYQAGKKRYNRRKNIIEKARNDLDAVYNRELDQQFQAGGQRQNSMLSYLHDLTGPEMAARAQADVGQRAAAIDAAIAPRSAEGAAVATGDTLDPTTAAAYGSVQRFTDAGNKLDMARALIDATGRAEGRRLTATGVQDSLINQRRTEERLKNQMEMERIQRWLNESLGTDSNAARNLDLLSQLLNTGATVGMQYASSRGGRSASSGSGTNSLWGGTAAPPRIDQD